LSLDNKNNEPGIIIGAVPYLRENEMRKPEAGETFDDKNQKLKEGIANHYSAITKKALEIKNNFKKEKKKNIPIILMGHLFTAEGKTTDGDGVRELYVGSLAHVKAGIFSDCVDYVALGHLHISQKVGKKENIRYSGSPLPIGFGEAKQQKQVIIVEFPEVIDYDMKITEINIPCFQRLELIKGDILKIQKRINELENDDEKVYIEIQYTGDDVIANLKEKVDKLTSGTKLEDLKILILSLELGKSILLSRSLLLMEFLQLQDQQVPVKLPFSMLFVWRFTQGLRDWKGLIIIIMK